MLRLTERDVSAIGLEPTQWFDVTVTETLEQIERYRERFYTPEIFWGMDGRIICLPLEVDYES